MSQQKLSTQPYKGARDFYPEEMRVRNYIFDTWKKVCKSYGYQEYDGPFIEPFEIYAAKSGEEIVNQQLYSFIDRGDRKVAIRPEMTPTLARMVAQKYKALPRPIRWFSIPNLWRYEKPQRGRLREHYQLNVDMFGISGAEADFEIVLIYYDLAKAFGAKDNMYQIRVGNRRLMDDVYKSFKISAEQSARVNKAIDKKNKITNDDFLQLLKNDAKLTQVQIDNLVNFLENPQLTIQKLANTSKGAEEVCKLLQKVSGYDNSVPIKYDPTIMRGFDYYTGNVFELYDLNPKNPRALSGGGRYDDLVEMFVGEKLTGIGFGLGDVTWKDFLETWNLLPSFESETEYLVLMWPNASDLLTQKTYNLAKQIRDKNKSCEILLETDTKIYKQLKYADKKGIKYAIMLGEEELKNNTVTIKDLKSGEQTKIGINQFISRNF